MEVTILYCQQHNHFVSRHDTKWKWLSCIANRNILYRNMAPSRNDYSVMSRELFCIETCAKRKWLFCIAKRSLLRVETWSQVEGTILYYPENYFVSGHCASGSDDLYWQKKYFVSRHMAPRNIYYSLIDMIQFEKKKKKSSIWPNFNNLVN